jgi:hypothetical protein
MTVKQLIRKLKHPPCKLIAVRVGLLENPVSTSARRLPQVMTAACRKIESPDPGDNLSLIG